jgi:hypothetical protein
VSSLSLTQGTWKGRTAGGCFNFPTWRNNPQYILKTSEKGKVTIELTQNEDNHIGFYVMKADGKFSSTDTAFFHYFD